MSPDKRKVFDVQNYVRGSIFVLVFALVFTLTIWLVPFPFSLMVIGSTLLMLPLINFVDKINEAVSDQVFDRLTLRRFGVEYSAGTLGDSWDRPYNEFRVEFKKNNWLLLNHYRVRLKHRVLPNLILESTFSKHQAEQTVKALVKNSPLKLLKDSDN